ncbi:DgyrCDS11313 [Dimorphilus gyrociliatus]|uniref:DgyrCDS11313 n=1 Tax=Dimorphilus gyrociliatus TaxID=2664684 RepID=A0A7I8W5G0_9ANNE|nr:DgyrCDS11313 [Dimorphilus gyrociliatus]
MDKISIFLISLCFYQFKSEILLPKPSHVIIASKFIRPDMTYRMTVEIFESMYEKFKLAASISNGQSEIASSSITASRNSFTTLEMKIPRSTVNGNYTLRLKSYTIDYSTLLFENITELTFQSKYISLFVQTDKVIYGIAQKMNFRIFAIKPNLEPVDEGQITIYLVNPKGIKVHRIKEKMLRNGIYEGSYFLPYPRVYGWWKFEIDGFGTTYEHKFYNYEYYQLMLEVNVTMPHYVMENEFGVYGVLTANWTKGYPVKGSADLDIEIFKDGGQNDIGSFRKHIPYFEGVTSFLITMEELKEAVKLSKIDGLKNCRIVVTATVNDQIYVNIPTKGKATTIIFEDLIKLRFLGGDIRTFKPGKNMDIYIAVSQSDNKPYSLNINRAVRIQTNAKKQNSKASEEKTALVLIGDDGIARYSFVPDDDDLQLTISVSHFRGNSIKMVAYREYSEINHYLSVTTSTVNPRIELKVNKGKDFSHNTVEVVVKGDRSSIIAINAQDYSNYVFQPNFFTKHRVEQELMTYNVGANSTLDHTWLRNEGIKDTMHYTASSSAIDANTTFQFLGLEIFTDARLDRLPSIDKCNRTLGFSSCFDGQCYELSTACDGVWNCHDGADEMGCPDPTESAVEKLQNIEMLHPELLYTYDDTSWLWKWNFTKPDGSSFTIAEVPHRPTTWLVSAITMSKEHGLAFVEEPFRFSSTRSFYIELEAPLRVVTGEQIGLKVTIFNYWHEPLEALITLHKSDVFKSISVPDDGFVTAFSAKLVEGIRQVMVRLEAGETKIIHFPIVTEIIGRHIVTVSGDSFVAKRTRSISIRVTALGINNRYLTCHLVDLLNHGTLSVPDFKIPIQERFILPEQQRHIYVPGTPIGELKIVGGTTGPETWDSARYLRMSINTGAGYAINLALHALWINFFKDQNAADKAKVSESLQGLAEGITQLMVYYDYAGNGRGYFAMWLDKKPSLFVTLNGVYALSQFYKNPEWIQQFLFIDLNVVHNATRWICEQQTAEGAFGEMHISTDDSFRSVITDEKGNFLNITMTAYTLTLLHDIYPVLNDNNVSSLASNAINKGLKYIASHLDKIDDPFCMAFVAYSMKLHDHFSTEAAVGKFMNMTRIKGGRYWSRVEIPQVQTEFTESIPALLGRRSSIDDAQSIIATGVGLLLDIATNGTERDLSIYTPTVSWLQSRRRTFYGWTSGPATFWALKGLMTYEKADKFVSHHYIKADITLLAGERKFRMNFNGSNWYNVQGFKFTEKVYGNVRVFAEGTGMFLIELQTMAFVEFEDQIKRSRNRVLLEADQIRYYGRNYSSIDITVCAQWFRPDLTPITGQADIEIGIPSGYYVLKEMLNNFTNSHPLIQDNDFSTSTQKATYYLDYLPPERTCVMVTAHRYHPVANFSIPHKLQAYNHFDMSKKNKSLYDTQTLSQLTICQAFGSYQCPYSPFYNRASTTANFSLYCILFEILSEVYTKHGNKIVSFGEMLTKSTGTIEELQYWSNLISCYKPLKTWIKENFKMFLAYLCNRLEKDYDSLIFNRNQKLVKSLELEVKIYMQVMQALKDFPQLLQQHRNFIFSLRRNLINIVTCDICKRDCRLLAANALLMHMQSEGLDDEEFLKFFKSLYDSFGFYYEPEKEVRNNTFSHVALLYGFLSLKCERYLEYTIDDIVFSQFLLNNILDLSAYGDFKYNVFKIWKILFTKIQPNSLSKKSLDSICKVLRGNFDCPIDGVRQFSFDILNILLKKFDEDKDLAENFYKFSTTLAWNGRLKYKLFCIVLQYIENNEILPEILINSLEGFTTDYLAPAAGDLCNFISSKLTYINVQVVIEAVKKAICNENKLTASRAARLWIPNLLRQHSNISNKLDEKLKDVSNEYELFGYLCFLNTCRSLNIISDISKFSNILEKVVIHVDEQIRMEALSFVTISYKKSEIPLNIEYELAMKGILCSLSVDDATFRKNLTRCVENFLLRICYSSTSIIKADTLENKQIYQAIDFLDKLWIELIEQLEPSSNFQRHKICLDLIKLYLDIIFKGPRKQRDVNGFPLLLEFANSKGRMLTIEKSSYRILICLLHTTDEIRETAYDILSDDNYPIKLENVDDLLEDSLYWLYSFKAHEADTGSLLFSLLIEKYYAEANKQLPIRIFGDSENVYVVALNFLTKQLKIRLNSVRLNTLEGAQKSPVHGILKAISLLISVNKSFWLPFWKDILDIVISLIDTALYNLGGKVSSQDEITPSFEQMGISIMNELDDDEESACNLPVEYQLILSWCWLCIKESSYLLGVAQKNMKLPMNEVKVMSNAFLLIMKRCRHRGAIESCNLGFKLFCEGLLKQDEIEYNNIPHHLLKDVMNTIRNGSNTSVTRRSAGFPYIVQTVLSTYSRTSLQPNLLDDTVKELVDIISSPLPQVDIKVDLPHFHALNILHAILKNSTLSSSITNYLDIVGICVLKGFNSDIWNIRNGCTQLFSSLLKRIFGQKKEEGVLLTSLSILEFEREYRRLFSYITAIFLSAKPVDMKELEWNIIPCLTILSSLATIQTEQDELPQIISLRQNVQKMLECPIYVVRHLAAKSLINLLRKSDYERTRNETLKKLEKTSNTNRLHGNLLVIDNLIALNEIETSLHTQELLIEKKFLLRHPCKLIASLYLRIVDKLLKGQDFIENILNTIKSIDINSNLAIGNDRYQIDRLNFTAKNGFLNNSDMRTYLDSYDEDVVKWALLYLLKMDYLFEFDEIVWKKFQSNVSLSTKTVCLDVLYQMARRAKNHIDCLNRAKFLLFNQLERSLNSTLTARTIELSSLYIKYFDDELEDERFRNILEIFSKIVYDSCIGDRPHQLQYSIINALESCFIKVQKKASNKAIFRFVEVINELLFSQTSEIRTKCCYLIIDIVSEVTGDKVDYLIPCSSVAFEVWITFLETHLSEYFMLSFQAAINAILCKDWKVMLNSFNSRVLYEEEDINIYRENVRILRKKSQKIKAFGLDKEQSPKCEKALTDVEKLIDNINNYLTKMESTKYLGEVLCNLSPELVTNVKMLIGKPMDF